MKLIMPINFILQSINTAILYSESFLLIVFSSFFIPRVAENYTYFSISITPY